MTPSTTNTAAQAGKSLYDEYSGNHPTIHSNRFPSWSELTQAQRDEWNRKAPESTIPPQAATLTQQQGGEQEGAWKNIETAEVEFLTNLAEKGGLADPVPGMLRHCARLIAGKRPAVVAPDRYETEEEGDAYAHGYVDGEDAAALRTKQPAASEGDDGDGVANCAECGAFLESVRPGKHQHPTCSQANTSKQAAGEAVATVCLRGDTYAHGLFTELQVQHKEGVTFPIGTKFYLAPRHPADDGRDADSYYAEKAREQQDMIVLDKYADIARALGFPCDTWFGDPLASHEAIVSHATKLAALAGREAGEAVSA